MSRRARHNLAVLTSVADSEAEMLRGVNVLDLDPKRITPALLKRLESSRAIEYVERMPARWTQAARKTKPKKNERTMAVGELGWDCRGGQQGVPG